MPEDDTMPPQGIGNTAGQWGNLLGQGRAGGRYGEHGTGQERGEFGPQGAGMVAASTAGSLPPALASQAAECGSPQLCIKCKCRAQETHWWCSSGAREQIFSFLKENWQSPWWPQDSVVTIAAPLEPLDGARVKTGLSDKGSFPKFQRENTPPNS